MPVQIARLLDEGYAVERHIVLVHDDGKWDERITERLAAAEQEPTQLTVVRLPNLKDLIAKSFAAAAAAPARLADDREGVSSV